MRRPTVAVLMAVGVTAIVAIGFSVAAIASSGSASGLTAVATTSETAPTSTSEQGKSFLHTATLSARAEVPKPTGARPGAGGSFTLVATDRGGKYTATWKLTFHNLTGKAVAAHIHPGKPGVAGPVAVPLCAPCRSGQTGHVKLSEPIVVAIEKGGAYVNVHTAKNKTGEIRGQISKKK